MTPITKTDIETYIQSHQAEIEEAWTQNYISSGDVMDEYDFPTETNIVYRVWREGYAYSQLQSIPGEVEKAMRNNGVAIVDNFDTGNELIFNGGEWEIHGDRPTAEKSEQRGIISSHKTFSEGLKSLLTQ